MDEKKPHTSLDLIAQKGRKCCGASSLPPSLPVEGRCRVSAEKGPQRIGRGAGWGRVGWEGGMSGEAGAVREKETDEVRKIKRV